jgi:hypothetical protein
MKYQRIFVLFSIVCGLGTAFADSQITPAHVPISLTISAPSLEVKAGSEFKLDIVLTNTSAERVLLSMYPWDFTVDVRDSEGNVVGKAKKASDSSERTLGWGSYQGRWLGPHEVVRWTEIVGKKLDLTKAGKYTVQATRTHGNATVKSNTITITVAP